MTGEPIFLSGSAIRPEPLTRTTGVTRDISSKVSPLSSPRAPRVISNDSISVSDHGRTRPFPENRIFAPARPPDAWKSASASREPFIPSAKRERSMPRDMTLPSQPFPRFAEISVFPPRTSADSSTLSGLTIPLTDSMRGTPITSGMMTDPPRMTTVGVIPRPFCSLSCFTTAASRAMRASSRMTEEMRSPPKKASQRDASAWIFRARSRGVSDGPIRTSSSLIDAPGSTSTVVRPMETSRPVCLARISSMLAASSIGKILVSARYPIAAASTRTAAVKIEKRNIFRVFITIPEYVPAS